MKQVNKKIIKQMQQQGQEIEVEIRQVVVESEVDKMWSFVSNKQTQRWLWHAIDHKSGVVLAYVFGAEKTKYFWN